MIISIFFRLFIFSLAVGASVELMEKVLDGEIHNRMGLVRPPQHHAMENMPCEFCGQAL